MSKSKEKKPVHTCNYCKHFKALPDGVPCRRGVDARLWKPCEEKEHDRRFKWYQSIEKKYEQTTNTKGE